MNIKKYIPLGLATALILGSVALATYASDSAASTGTQTPPAVTQQVKHGNRLAVMAAIQAGDYDAWVKAVSVNGQVPDNLKVITKDNFAQYVQMFQLMKAGQMDQAKQIADTLGLKFMGKGEGPGPMTTNTAANTAIQNGDYDAWVKAVTVNGQVPGFLKAVTKDNFAKFDQAMKLQQQAMDLMKQSHDILQSIGVNPPGPGFRGKGHGPRGMGGMMGGWFGPKGSDQTQNNQSPQSQTESQ